MSGYTLKIAAKLIVDNTDPQAMAEASALIKRLQTDLGNKALNDIKVTARYHDRLTADDVAG